jgi:hypothetical protein
MTSVNQTVTDLLKQVITWLVDGDYASVEARTRGVRLSRDLIQEAIHEYGRKLIPPPQAAFENLDAIRVTNALHPTWSIRFDLWTQEEGRSDLSIECTVIDRQDGTLVFELDNIHVL